MTLWRVEVGGVSHRYVEADSAEDAVHAVTVAVVEAMDIRASAAPADLAKAYDRSGRLQRKRLLAAMDGLCSPVARKDSARARRQLERLQEHDERMKAWVDSAMAGAPPPSPETLDRIAKLGEVRHVERNLARFHAEIISAVHER